MWAIKFTLVNYTIIWTTLCCTITISRNLLNNIFINLILQSRILQWNKLCQIVKGFKVENVCCCYGKAIFFQFRISPFLLFHYLAARLIICYKPSSGFYLERHSPLHTLACPHVHNLLKFDINYFTEFFCPNPYSKVPIIRTGPIIHTVLIF